MQDCVRGHVHCDQQAFCTNRAGQCLHFVPLTPRGSRDTNTSGANIRLLTAVEHRRAKKSRIAVAGRQRSKSRIQKSPKPTPLTGREHVGGWSRGKCPDPAPGPCPKSRKQWGGTGCSSVLPDRSKSCSAPLAPSRRGEVRVVGRRRDKELIRCVDAGRVRRRSVRALAAPGGHTTWGSIHSDEMQSPICRAAWSPDMVATDDVQVMILFQSHS
jgi:hypothetical protein